MKRGWGYALGVAGCVLLASYLIPEHQKPPPDYKIYKIVIPSRIEKKTVTGHSERGLPFKELIFSFEDPEVSKGIACFDEKGEPLLYRLYLKNGRVEEYVRNRSLCRGCHPREGEAVASAAADAGVKI